MLSALRVGPSDEVVEFAPGMGVTARLTPVSYTAVERDEGFFRALRFAFNVLRDRDARRRVFEMRRVFRRRREQIAAVAITAVRV